MLNRPFKYFLGSISVGIVSAAWVSLFLAFVFFLGLLAVGPTSS